MFKQVLCRQLVNTARGTDTSVSGRGAARQRHVVRMQSSGNGKQAGNHQDKMRMPSKGDNPEYLTENNGEPLVNNRNSMTVGPRGPILFEDAHLVNKLAQFNREKVPERVVHARGMTAKGFFEVEEDISDLTCAELFSEVGKQVKFYTQQGNWDMVGNNIPVFFIRDGMAFPDLVHALRPNPRNNIQEGWRILDFLSNYPESCHMLTWMLDEPGIPTDYRHMEGYGVNTFKFVSSEGKETLVKFHIYPKLGAKFMSDEKAQTVGELNMRHSHATHDLYNSIAAEDYPEWDFKIQTMDPADQLNFDFDPLDCTKIWPEEQFPLQHVGRLVLNQNIDNFHNENEQIAFAPGRSVPGITWSDDKVLQSRVNAYQDTQRYRIGVHYDMLPINQPRCPFHLNAEAGSMNFSHDNGEVNYFPSSKTEDPGHTAHEAPATFQYASQEQVQGVRTKEDIGDNGGKWDDFKQAGDRWRDMSLIRKGIFLKTLGSWMADPKTPQSVRDRWIEIFSQCDSGLGAELSAGVAALKVGAGLKDKLTGRPAEKGATVA